MFGSAGRIGMVVPANNATLEPELWPRLPRGVALYCTKILARGDLTPRAVRDMEVHFDRAVDELAATGVDVLVYADMVTTFVMEPDWDATRTAAVTARTGIPCISAWSALQSALAACDIVGLALGTPYPAGVHVLARPFLELLGYRVVADRTLDIAAMTEVPRVTTERLHDFVSTIPLQGAEALVLLATDLPTFDLIDRLENETGLPVLTSNQAILWSALRACGNREGIVGLGRLFDA